MENDEEDALERGLEELGRSLGEEHEPDPVASEDGDEPADEAEEGDADALDVAAADAAVGDEALPEAEDALEVADDGVGAPEPEAIGLISAQEPRPVRTRPWATPQLVAVALVVGLSSFAAGYLAQGLIADGSEASAEDAETEAADTVAATVGEAEIWESEVTAMVEALRAAYGVEDDSDWAEFMETYGYTASSIRDLVLSDLVYDEVVRQMAEAQGISPTEDEIDEAWDEAAEELGLDADEFLALVEGSGYTEQEYRDVLADGLAADELLSEVTGTVTVTDEDVDAYLLDNSSTYVGAKRAEALIIDEADTELFESATDLLGRGYTAEGAALALDGAQAYFSGWDCDPDLPTSAIAAALTEIEEGEVYPSLIETEDGYLVVACTDVYEEGDAPDSLYEIVEAACLEEAQDEAWEAWYEQAQEELGVSVTEMPEGLSYDVELEDDGTEEE